MNRSYDVCIIGAGAAGLAAANSLSSEKRICMIDKNRIPGRKILATGGGRCNLTNRACRKRDETLDFFSGLGLELWSDAEGRYYPYSRMASDVCKALVDGLKGRDVDWVMGAEVTGIEPLDTEDSREGRDRFRIFFTEGDDEKSVWARNVILCTGGKAAPRFGTTGDGYRLAKKLGHKVSRTYPILTGINCQIPDHVAGVRAQGQVSLLKDEEIVAERKGEIQFTKEGISGICVFDLSLFIRAEEGEDPKKAMRRYRVKIDFAPHLRREEVEGRKDSFGIVTESLSRWISPGEIKNTILPVEGVWGWDKAQCTGGGVMTEDIDEETMESRIIKGLYFAGEIMDIQGPCGGFNLQNAWETGIRAAKAIEKNS